LSWEWTFECQ